MTSSLLQSIETKEQLHNVLSAINEAFPNQAPIENELGKYTASKEQAIRRLQQEWYNRTLPLYTELQVRQMNSAYYSERAKKQIAADLEGRTFIDMDAGKGAFSPIMLIIAGWVLGISRIPIMASKAIHCAVLTNA